jgi:hypothetical protein
MVASFLDLHCVTISFGVCIQYVKVFALSSSSFLPHPASEIPKTAAIANEISFFIVVRLLFYNLTANCEIQF